MPSKRKVRMYKTTVQHNDRQACAAVWSRNVKARKKRGEAS